MSGKEGELNERNDPASGRSPVVGQNYTEGDVSSEIGDCKRAAAATPDSVARDMAHLSVVHRARESRWPAVPMDQALDTILKAALPPTLKNIPVALTRVGHVLAEPVRARWNVPPMRTSIKDGYAVMSSDTAHVRSVVGALYAGDTPTSIAPLQPGQCVRVSTGAPVPLGADAVVMVEKTKIIQHDGFEEQLIHFEELPQSGQDIREPGSDVRAGDLLLDTHAVLGSAELGVLAGSGRKEVAVFRRPKVCVMSTGNEVVDCSTIRDELAPGQLRDTNRPQLLGLFAQHGFKPIDAGIVGDTREQLVEALKVAFRFASVIVTSGGVSMGERDLFKPVLEQDFHFTIHFGRVFMKPGLPTTFATGVVEGEKKIIFGLPGNPVSAWVCAQLFVLPALWQTAGQLRTKHTEIRVRTVKLDPRPEYRRAWLKEAEGGEGTQQLPIAISTGNQISSRLQSLAGANLLLKMPPKSESQQQLPAGTVVTALVVGQL